MSPLIELKSSPKHYTLDQDKTKAPLETVKFALEHLKGRYDISNLKVEEPKQVIPGACQCTVSSDQFASSGKGATLDQSRASGVMEFVERYTWLHFEYKRYEGFSVKSYKEILETGTQTVERSYFLKNYIEVKDPEALTSEIANIPLKWIRGTCLTDRKEYYYPLNWNNMVMSSNGLASGNTLEEAIMQALCEVVERENISRLFIDKLAGRDLDQSSIKNPIIVNLLEKAKKYGIKFVLKEISSDLGLPTFIARGTRANLKGGLTYQGVGQGTHSDPEKALIRSISEYFEGLALMLKADQATGLDLLKMVKHLPKQHFGFLALYNPEMLEEKGLKIKMKDIKNVSRQDIKEEVEEAVARLAAKNYKVVVIDKTIKELNIPAVRVFIPGMRCMINTEIYTPESVLSEVYCEAKQYDQAQKHFDAALNANPGMRGSPLLNRNVKKVYRGDYRENLLRHGGLKRKGLDNLKNIEKAFGLLLKDYKKTP